MLKKVIVHAKFKSLTEFNEKQESVSFSKIDDPLNNNLIFYKLDHEKLCLEMSDKKLDVYFCQFTERKNYEQAFFKGESIPYVDIVHSFRAYVCQEDQVIFFNVKTDVGLKFIKKYNYLVQKLKLNTIEVFEVDFDYIESRAKEVKGSWFSKESGLVTSQGLMGNQIEKSMEFTGLKDSSTVSSLTIGIYVKEVNTDVSVIISGKGSLYIQNSIPKNINPIDLLWILFKHLIFDQVPN